MRGLVVGRYIFTDTSKRERGGGALFFRVMAMQGDKISFLQILNYTSTPPLLNYDQSLINFLLTSLKSVFFNKTSPYGLGLYKRPRCDISLYRPRVRLIRSIFVDGYYVCKF
jgi:hypothetical protein